LGKPYGLKKPRCYWDHVEERIWEHIENKGKKPKPPNFLIGVGGHLIFPGISLFTKSGVILHPLLKSGRDVPPEIS
jgi:hypothetical protein